MSVQRGAQLVVVHAVSKNTPYSWGAVERVTVLAALRERAEALKVPVRVRTQQGDTAEVVLLHASAQAPDVIVLGSHEPSASRASDSGPSRISREGSHLPGTARSSRDRTSHAFLPSGRVCG